MKRKHESEDEEDEDEEQNLDKVPSFWKDWVRFISNKDTREKFHPYSPEANNVIRCGKEVSPRPLLDRQIYRQHVMSHKNIDHPFPEACISYIDSVVDSVNKPTILRLVEEEDKKGMSQLGPFYSAPNSPS